MTGPGKAAILVICLLATSVSIAGAPPKKVPKSIRTLTTAIEKRFGIEVVAGNAKAFVKKAIAAGDKNGDSLLTVAEVERVLAKLEVGNWLTRGRWATKVSQRGDRDGSGRVCCAELAALFDELAKCNGQGRSLKEEALAKKPLATKPAKKGAKEASTKAMKACAKAAAATKAAAGKAPTRQTAPSAAVAS